MVKKKIQSAFFCQNCGTQSPKWLGKCPSCGEWNTYVEEVINRDEKTKSWNRKSSKTNTPSLISDINFTSTHFEACKMGAISFHHMRRILSSPWLLTSSNSGRKRKLAGRMMNQKFSLSSLMTC